MTKTNTTAAEPVKIPPADLVDLNGFEGQHPVRVDVVYAKADHPRNIFGTAIYRADAHMWAHKDMARVILKAAALCHAQSGWIFEIKDCLRTVEAQEKMRETDIVKRNPHWLQEPNRLLSPPGLGGHPRGMAVDIVLLDKQGHEVDMGTPFDFLSEDRANNPAARNYTHFPDAVLKNRKFLEDVMVRAGKECGFEIYPLPQEWWDFRFMPDYSRRFAPIHDAELPAHMRMT